MGEFAGYDMPIFYRGIIEEHLAVRNSAGMFDAGHMGIIEVGGEEALNFLQTVTTNDSSLLKNMESQYSLICNESGGVIDDVLVYKIDDYFFVVSNASNKEKVFAHFKKISDNNMKVSLKFREDLFILAAQGPKAIEHFQGFEGKKGSMSLFKGTLTSRTGYTGEDGVELFISKELGINLWRQLLNSGVVPCGLGARDTLRLEAGLPLYGHEYNEETTPIEVGYRWAVKFTHDFIGRKALEEKLMPTKKIVGLKFNSKVIPRQGNKIFFNNNEVGVVTSGTFSPSLKMPIALGFVKSDFAKIDLVVKVEIRNSLVEAVVVQKKMI